ncbi:MAG: peptidylprolyl isomerase [Oscillospiraceae bacterium]|nr:peptidylprolyl isomerase [Oscillospiraceae bacterium]
MGKSRTFAALTAAAALALASCGPKEPPFIGVTGLTGGNTGETALEKGDEYAVISVRGYGDIWVKLLPECAPVAVRNFIDLIGDGYYDGKKFHRVMEGFMIQGGSPNGDGLADMSGETFAVERAYNARHFYGALCMANSYGRNSQQFYIVNNKEPNDPAAVSAAGYKASADEAKALVDMYGAQMDERTLEYYNLVYDSYNDIYNGMTMFRENLTDEIIEKYKSGGAAFLDGGYTVFGQTVKGFDVLDAVSAAEVGPSDPGDPNSEKSAPVEDIIIESVRVYTYEE